MQPTKPKNKRIICSDNTVHYSMGKQSGNTEVMINDECDMCMLSTAIYTVVIQSGCSIQSHFNTPNDFFLRVNNFDSGLND